MSKWTKESSFESSADGVRIAYATLIHQKKNKSILDLFVPDKENVKASIVFFTGYKETYEKYLPFLEDLHKEGYFNIYTMDHRSQGLSGDSPGTIYEKGFHDGSGRRICYVENFEKNYVADMRYFIETIVKPDCMENGSSICVVAHSMGGLLAARLAELTGISLFDRMVLSAPMFEHKNILNVAGLDIELPIEMATAIANFMVDTMDQAKVKADGRDTFASEGTTELLTHCPKKRKAWDALRAKKPNVVLAGASFGWAKAALEMESAVMLDTHLIKIPTLILMADDDAFVYNSAIQSFAATVGRGKTKLVGPIANSYHEILVEKDSIVTPVKNAIRAFTALGKLADYNTIDYEMFPIKEIESIPVAKTDDNRTWPEGYHSPSTPSSTPTILNPTARLLINSTVKLLILAIVIQVGITVFR